MQFKEWQILWSRRPRARGLTLRLVGTGPLRLVTPKGISWSQALDFLAAQEDWIQTNYSKLQEQQAKFPPKRLKADEKYLFLGVELQLKYLATPLKSVFFSRSTEELRLHLPEALYHSIQAQELAQYLPLLQKYYRREAEKFLRERIKLWATQMGLEYQKLSFRRQKTRWGSCNSKGNISLNWKLIATPLEVIDSVLVHELAHLRHMNHSAQFWELVEQHCPSYQQSDRWLRQNYGAMEFLAP